MTNTSSKIQIDKNDLEMSKELQKIIDDELNRFDRMVQELVGKPENGDEIIKVSEGELEAMVPELNGILAWVEQMGEVDVTGIEPMTAVIENTLRLRDDVINADPLTGGGVRDSVLANAPAAEHGFFGVPKVIE
jgi:aspartyl-tRNA(Asn)/glutamyl-tRNA(Gln) amidotransferase subunit C